MRKDADFAIEQKVRLTYTTTSGYLRAILKEFDQMLKWEALLLMIEEQEANGIISSEFVSWDERVYFTLA